MPVKIYLASSSPRRQELMEQLGLFPEKVTASVEEVALPNESAASFVVRMAVEKADAAYSKIAGNEIYVVAGDTIVVCDGKVFGKPANQFEAKKTLQALSGKTHTVISAVALMHDGATYSTKCVTKVSFKKLTQQEIENYTLSGESEGKAGAYAIQGKAATFISKIEGSYSSVMGLPLFELNELLEKSGYYREKENA